MVQRREQMMQSVVTKERHYFKEVPVYVGSIHNSLQFMHAPVDSRFPEEK